MNLKKLSLNLNLIMYILTAFCFVSESWLCKYFILVKHKKEDKSNLSVKRRGRKIKKWDMSSESTAYGSSVDRLIFFVILRPTI